MHCVLLCWLHVGVVLFLAEKAVSLDCETCHSLVNHTCDGPMETCQPHHDKCAIVLSKSVTEKTSIVKTCVSSSQCETQLTVLNTGKDRRILTKIFCCTSNQCKNISFSFPPMNTTFNGKKCKACYYWGNGDCPEKTVKCWGEEIYCLEVFGIGDTGRLVVPITIKGCVNKAICGSFVNGPLLVGGVTISGKAKCVPASRTDDPIPNLSALILQVLTVLQFMWILP